MNRKQTSSPQKKAQTKSSGRSEELGEIIDRMPMAFGKWVALAVVIFAALFLLFGWIIKYPDMGYTAAKDCVPADAPYNVEKDITFFEGLAETYVAVKPGMFAIFFPQDGHAPGITPDGVKKVIVKVKA